jgi:peptidoglycan/LPS O-acetylase OafA/YrhL
MPQNLKPLTAMRFFAAMWVVAFHYTPSLTNGMPAVIAKGYLGVELFFVLSGFILSHVYMQAFGEGRFRYADFLWARLARIYPVHTATLVGLGLLVAAASVLHMNTGDQVLVWPSLPAQLTLTQAWGLASHGGWNHPSWSISAEWFAYLTFPLFALVIWPLRHRPGVAVAFAVLFVAVLNLGFARIAGFPLTRATILWGALRIVPCFAFGCAVWLLWRADRIRSSRLAVGGVIAALTLVVGATLLETPDWMTVSIFGLLILSLASLPRTGSKLLSAPAWVYLGEVSFSVYMVCVPWQLVFEHTARKVLHLTREGLPMPLWIVLFVGVVPAAMALHHLVERPAREAMRRHGVPFRRHGQRSAGRLSGATATARNADPVI